MSLPFLYVQVFLYREEGQLFCFVFFLFDKSQTRKWNGGFINSSPHVSVLNRENILDEKQKNQLSSVHAWCVMEATVIGAVQTQEGVWTVKWVC